MTARLCVTDLVKVRGGAADRFELRVPRFALAGGDRLAVVGPSGCGKSTLVELLGLASAPDGGSFRVEDGEGGAVAVDALWRERRSEKLAQLRARLFGYVPQTGALLPFLTVRRNLALTQELSGRVDPAFVRACAEHLDIGGLLERWPSELSAGQRQRVAIARAVVHRPSFILADEPTANLDPAAALKAMVLLSDLVRDTGAALLVVSHDRELIERAKLEPAVMTSERAEGSWRSVVASPARVPA
jgi:ABC-type lipoprotein export system ATPase subunit